LDGFSESHVVGEYASTGASEEEGALFLVGVERCFDESIEQWRSEAFGQEFIESVVESDGVAGLCDEADGFVVESDVVCVAFESFDDPFEV
jgi:hypothetical protein